jgi:hypothetical protein
MNYWFFKGFIGLNGISFIDEWYAFLQEKDKAAFDTRLAYLGITKYWIPKYFKKLKGYDHIYEHCFKFSNMQHRPLGCFGPKDNEFTFLIGTTKREKVFNPRNAVNLAIKRRNYILQDRRYIDEIDNLQKKLIDKTKK